MNTSRDKIWTAWAHKRPPYGVKVYGLYEGKDESPHLGQACKRGCCWYPASHGESCVPPKWWSADGTELPQDAAP
jgi:hypothetical protein